MKLLSYLKNYFTRAEIVLWASSAALILISYLLFDRKNPLTLATSLIGVTFLILNAKGNPLGQLLTVVFSVLYGIISYSSAYYGEMITYLGMTAPMAVYAMAEWLRHPAQKGRAEVKVNRLGGRDIARMLALTALVTVLFYFILGYFHTARLAVSTLSVTTSFLAVYLTARRSAYFALAYAMNDAVLIALWICASTDDISRLSVVICFAVFFVNDLYGFVNWRRMRGRQEGAAESSPRG